MIVLAQACAQGVHWPSAALGLGVGIAITALLMELLRSPPK